MKKNILNHVTVTGFTNSKDFSSREILENDITEAKDRLKLAKKDLKEAKLKLNQALEDDISEIENKKKEIIETQNNLIDNTESTSAFNIENIKSKYVDAVNALETRKNKIIKKIEEYNVDGTENWESFKHKINHDLEELGTTLKSFVKKSK